MRHMNLHCLLGRLLMLCACAAVLPCAAADAPFLRELAPGVYLHQGLHQETTRDNAGDIANIGFIVGERCIAVVDTGGSVEIGERLLRAIRQRSSLPICYVIHTHAHPDHVFGDAAFLKEKPAFIGHAHLPAALQARWPHYRKALERELGEASAAQTAMIIPQRTVQDTLRLDLGGRMLLLQAWPTAHTDADLTVMDERSGALWLGDLLFQRRVPALDGSLKGWLAVLERLRDMPVRIAIPGHGEPSRDWPGALDAEQRYLRELHDEVAAAIRQGKTIAQTAAEAAHDHAGEWLLFSDYQVRNVTAAYTELEWEN
jgi:quinoprotein relay system zinc metallohydrolase 2